MSGDSILRLMVLHKKLALLQNPSTQFNCFFNAPVQLLWVIVFARDVLSTTKIEEVVGLPSTLLSQFLCCSSSHECLGASGCVLFGLMCSMTA